MGKQLLPVILILTLAPWIWQNRQVWLAKYDVPYWQDAFEDSQIVRGDKARAWLSDYDLYAIVGYKYWRGDNPMNLHPEVPPLGKYLIGASILVFGNPAVMNLILGMAGLFLLYLTARQLDMSAAAAWAGILLVSLDQNFRTLLATSNLDIPHLFWLSLSLFSFLKSASSPRWFWLSSFSLGLMMATKFYFTGLLLLGVYLLVLLVRRHFPNFIVYVSSLIFVPLGYVLAYVPALIYRPDVIGWLRFQRWLTGWWAGNATAPWGGIFPLLLAGRWHTWWSQRAVILPGEWSVLWPLTAALGLAAVVKIASRRRLPLFLIWLWPVVYLAWLSFTSVFPRYLVALTPFLSMLTVYLISHENHTG